MTDPFRPADEEARALAARLLAEASFAALATLQDGAPMVTRIALATDPDGLPLTLVSTLASHTAALQSGAEASILIGEPGQKGDPLTHPRLTLQARPEPVTRDSAEHAALAAHYVGLRPKARLYIDFADFLMVRFHPLKALLNGGFGRAYRLTAKDLRARPPVTPPEAGRDPAGPDDADG